MLSEQILNLLSEQVTTEFSASHMYLQFSLATNQMAYDGFSKYFLKQSEEERKHALKICDYILDRGAIIKLKNIDLIDFKFEIKNIFVESLQAEKNVTIKLSNIYKIAMAEGDYCTVSFLKEFLDEQVKAEREISLILNQLEMIEGDNGALLFYDSEIGKD